MSGYRLVLVLYFLARVSALAERAYRMQFEVACHVVPRFAPKFVNAFNSPILLNPAPALLLLPLSRCSRSIAFPAPVPSPLHYRSRSNTATALTLLLL